jgi:hypothetical protein
MRRFLAVLCLMAIPRLAIGEDCANTTNIDEQMQCFRRQMMRSSADLFCSRNASIVGEAECMRAWAVEQAIAEICNTDTLKNDKVACLERRVEALTRELSNLRRQIPRMVEEGIRKGLEPRIHK